MMIPIDALMITLTKIEQLAQQSLKDSTSTEQYTETVKAICIEARQTMADAASKEMLQKLENAAADLRKYIESTAKAELVISSEWLKVENKHPPAHTLCLVRRLGYVFTCTPCYGMHKPWWVPRAMLDAGLVAESAPVCMKETDEWQPLIRDAT